MSTNAVAAQRVRLYLSEHDRPAGQHEPLWEVLLNRLQREHVAGATVFRGLALLEPGHLTIEQVQLS
jgi:PII-like signaling protein